MVSAGPEGRTIKHFVTKQIAIFEKEPVSVADKVRQFLDSMHTYIIDNRMEEMEGIIQRYIVTILVLDLDLVFTSFLSSLSKKQKNELRRWGRNFSQLFE